jgi:hypothetical protein
MGRRRPFTHDELVIIDRIADYVSHDHADPIKVTKTEWEVYARWNNFVSRFAFELEGLLPFLLSPSAISHAMIKAVIVEGGKRL